MRSPEGRVTIYLIQLANLGEFVGGAGSVIGGLAVLVTLIYLAVQLKQNNAMVRSQVHQEVSRRSTEMLFFLSEPERVALLFQGMADYNSMSEEEQFRTINYFVGFMNYYENMFYARERGDLDNELWQSRVFRMRRFFGLASPSAWKAVRLQFGRRFREFIETEIFATADRQGPS